MKQRVIAIDALRGIMIILMILGHTRNFFTPLTYDPIELGEGPIELYLMRVLTNLAAPTFYFLSGMGIYFLAKSHGNIKRASKDIFIRGVLLILLDMVIVSIPWFWTLSEYTFFFGVLWSLGASMIMLSVLVHLPIRYIAGFAAAVLLGHNLLDGMPQFDYQGTVGSFLLMLFHGKITVFDVSSSIKVFFGYAIIPWVAVMSLGYVIAHTLFASELSAAQRQRYLVYFGLSLLGFFVILRTLIGYGDMIRWSWDASNPTFSLLYFFKTSKYPGSLQYLLFSIGIGCLLLALLDKTQPTFAKYTAVLGQAPLFLYIIHVPIVHGTAWILHHMMFGERLAKAPEMLIPLPVILMIWLALCPLFYWACKTYRPIKMKYKHTVLRYI